MERQPDKLKQAFFRPLLIGSLRVVHNGESIIESTPTSATAPSKPTCDLEQRIAIFLDDYAKKRNVLMSFPLDYSGHSSYFVTVWQALLEVPFGETRSYSWLAQKVGMPRSTRRIGSIIGINPFLIFLPCHRIIYKNGELGGYRAGGGWKNALLNYEAQK